MFDLMKLNEFWGKWMQQFQLKELNKEAFSCPFAQFVYLLWMFFSFPPFHSPCMLLLCWWITRGGFGSVAMVISMLPQRLLPLSIATFMALMCALQYYWNNFLVTNYSSCYKYSTLFQSLFDLTSAEAAWNISASLQLYL